MQNPTLLEIPQLINGMPSPGGQHQQIELPLDPAAYKVQESDGWWFVTVRASGTFVYAGPGPARVGRSPAPF